MDFGTFRDEAFAAFGPAFAKDVSSCSGCHAGAKAVLTLADSLGGLVSHFHDRIKKWGAEKIAR